MEALRIEEIVGYILLLAFALYFIHDADKTIKEMKERFAQEDAEGSA